MEEFQEDGHAETSFPDQPVPIVLETIKRRTFFTVDTTRVMVEPDPFISSLVDEAERFFQWALRNLGEGIPLRQIEGIRARLSQ